MIISAPRLTVGLLENAMDSLVEGCQRFSRGASSRNLKAAVLQITQAVELFLKARLAKEHYLLVFVDPGKIGKEARTVDLNGALERLRAAGVSIDGAQELGPLKHLRNRLQHFELDQLEEVLTKQVGLAVKFLEPFLEKELEISLRESLPKDVYFVVQKAGLEYEEALQLALARRDEELAGLPASSRERTQVLDCDLCGQATILYPNPTTIPPDQVRCYFCDTRHVVSRCHRCQQFTVEGDPCDTCSNR